MYILIKYDTSQLIHLESPVNPTLDLVDIAEVVRQVRAVRADIIISVDNTFMTPILQRPLDLGADVSVYSCSKYLGGHGDIIMGAVTTNSVELKRRIHKNLECKQYRPNAENLSRIGAIPI